METPYLRPQSKTVLTALCCQSLLSMTLSSDKDFYILSNAFFSEQFWELKTKLYVISETTNKHSVRVQN